MTSSPFLFSSQKLEKRLWSRLLFNAGKYPLEHLLGLRRLDYCYREFFDHDWEADFFTKVCEALTISCQVDEESLLRIPKEGPVIVVANHPFGAAEAVLTASILLKQRPDVRILANFMLSRLPGIVPYLIQVDPFERSSAISANITPLRHSINWLNRGGLLLTYPSGTVSHFNLKKGEITDPEWNPAIGRIVRKSQATVLPIHYPGRNSLLFQTAGLIHPSLRTIQIPRELALSIGKTFQCNIGRPIPFEKLSDIKDDRELIAYLRMRTYLLANKETFTPEEKQVKRAQRINSKRLTTDRVQEPIAPPLEKRLILGEVQELEESRKLYETDAFLVFWAKAKQIPNILQEIGRLRELTFREVAEGTGKARDLDRFDDYYIHLCLWSKTNQELVGAYRIGKIDRIIRAYGVRGLYTHTLFKYSPATMRRIGPALELGRSFVRKEYQKNYSSLLLLWKGIGAYVVQNPRYKILLGPVSISSRYNAISRLLITLFLRANNFKEELEKFIIPRNPIKQTKLSGIDPKMRCFAKAKLEDISELLGEIESSERYIPVLLRQYLRMGGKLLGFNVDPSFGDCLDGLIYVDLTQSDLRLLEKYLGREGSASFLRYHQLSSEYDVMGTGSRR